MATDPSSKMVALKSSDGVEFVVSEMVARHSPAIRHMIDVDSGQGIILIPNVSSNVLRKVIEYCKQHVEGPPRMSDVELQSWDQQFLVTVDQADFLHLLMAAHYLEISKLFDAACREFGKMTERMTTSEIREAFNIENDFTPDEIKEMRRLIPRLFQ